MKRDQNSNLIQVQMYNVSKVKNKINYTMCRNTNGPYTLYSPLYNLLYNWL